MTHAQLEQQSRDAVIAYLQDSSVWLEYAIKRADGVINWRLEENHVSFYFGACYYRIAQPKPKPWYRVALMTFGTKTVDDENIESYLETNDCFIKWLTERIPYDV